MSDTQEENSTLNKMSQSKDNESDNINLHDNSSESLRRSERNRKLTENGMEWKINRHLANFRNAVSMWRKCANRVQVVRSDSTSLDEIRKARDKLDGSIGEISEIYQETLQVLAQGVDRGDLDNNESLENELLKKYESIECEHQHIMRDIANHIREMEAVRSETKSTRSRGSLSSSRSTSSSNKSAATIKAAELKARLKYIDIEARSKVELEKIQTMKELDVTRAKLEVMDTFDNLENSFAELDIKPSIESLPSFGAGEYTENYVRTQEAQPSKTDEKPQQEWSNTENSIYLNEPLSKPSENSGNITGPIYSSITSDVGTLQLGTSSSTVLNPHLKEFIPRCSSLTQASSVPTHGISMMQSAPRVVSSTQNQTRSSTFPTNVNFEPVSQPTTYTPNTGSEHGLLQLAKTLAEQVGLSRLPPPEPGVFLGDPLKYPGWKAAFQTLIEQRQIPSSERIHYLKKYLGGAVKEVVENYFLLSTDDAYDDAKKLLDERYGNSFVVANAFRDKLDKWPKIYSRDVNSLQKYADFLRQCLAAMQSIGSLDILNDNRENRKMLAKLPDWIVNRWSRIVIQRKEETKVFPPFKDFVEFIGREAKIACDPITSIHSFKSENSRSDEERPSSTNKQSRRNHTGRSFVTEVDVSPATSVENEPKQRKVKCVLCQNGHELDDCRQFLAKPLDKRKVFAKEKGLCFGCLRFGHISKKCKQRKQCKTCSKSHPSSLHGDVRKPAESADKERQPQDDTNGSESKKSSLHSSSTFMSRSGTCSKSSMIVPVYISHRDNPAEEKLVYALLDTQSDTTFILEDTYRSLKLTGTEVKLLLSTMYAENRLIDSNKVKGLMVRGFNSSVKISLPDTFTRNIMPANRSHIPTPEMARQWPHLEPIAEELMPLRNCEISLLIGYNCSRALAPRDVIAPVNDGPYAQRTDLGWGIVGIVDRDCVEAIEDDLVGTSHCCVARRIPKDLSKSSESTSENVVFSFRSSIKEVINPVELTRMMERDFIENNSEIVSHSHDDRCFLVAMEEGIHHENGHYEMPLPFREAMPYVPNNKSQSLNRLHHLKRRLEANAQYKEHYITFMERLIQNNFTEKVPDKDLELDDGHQWYIPHHGIYHPQKPNKIRVVFDCSAKHKGESLNAHLLQGPDFTNKLVGVLCRFRKEQVAFMCDIEQMFFQFKVNPEHRDYLRFLWWENGNLSEQPVDFRMSVHLFAAASSTGCANFGLKRIADDHEAEFGTDVANFVRRDFYVDDGVKSVPTIEEDVHIIDNTKEMLRRGGLRLHKFLSSSKNVLQHIPLADRAQGLKDIDVLQDQLPVERALGVQWCIESDTFQFRITLNDRPLTRRGVLSTLCSVYDPLGFIAPFILVGKQILQQMCKDKTDWDSPLSDDLSARWLRWRLDLNNLKDLKVNRCLKPSDFGETVSVELHHFSDASTQGYGQCSYVRLVNTDGRVHCALVMGKARVVPLKPITIPRSELVAALVSVRMSSMLIRELDYSNVTEWFWTDSSVVLGYIANDSRRFHVFVANRVQQIRDHTEPSQWEYVTSENNPADIASRGATADDLINHSIWFSGPRFLWETDPLASCDTQSVPSLSFKDPEVKKAQVFETATTPVEEKPLIDRLDAFSDWQRAKKAVALCLIFKRRLRTKSVRFSELKSSLEKTIATSKRMTTVEELQEAETAIISLVQRTSFQKEIEYLHTAEASHSCDSKQKVCLKSSSSLCGLDPFLDDNGILRVGGRIKHGDFDASVKHPIILPRKSHVTELVIRHYHERVEHQGRGITTGEIRANGFWIVGCSSAVSSYISKCVTCRKLRGITQGQRMADLPADRLSPEPPFTYSGVDFFGPFYIKEGRKELKRYGVIFTCMSSRAIHVETANSLDTSSFINALRRFLAIRGPVRQLRSDRGTNFVGAERELREELEGLDDCQLQQFLSREGCDFISFKMNVPSASHMGGVWERQIRSVRNVLASLMLQSGSQLDDETLRTFMCEAAAIVNSRPLSATNLNDPHSAEPLTPNHLLTMKSKVILPPPGQFQKTDLYSRRRWRRVQYLANEFWNRWRKEFLQNLQVRNKWISPKRNMRIGDVVLIMDDNQARNHWRMGRVEETFCGEDGFVRKVKVAVGDPTLDNQGRRADRMNFLERPIHKLVFLHETGEFHTEEP